MRQLRASPRLRDFSRRVVLTRASGGGAPPPFHLAIPVNDLAKAREFYGVTLGCDEGRSSARWVDWNLFGHQVVTHLVDNYRGQAHANPVDGDPVPVPHFGLALSQDDFNALADKVRDTGVKFEIEPHVRFAGQPGEQSTMFFFDPSGNALEFKAMTFPENLFAKYEVSSSGQLGKADGMAAGT